MSTYRTENLVCYTLTAKEFCQRQKNKKKKKGKRCQEERRDIPFFPTAFTVFFRRREKRIPEKSITKYKAPAFICGLLLLLFRKLSVFIIRIMQNMLFLLKFLQWYIWYFLSTWGSFIIFILPGKRNILCTRIPRQANTAPENKTFLLIWKKMLWLKIRYTLQNYRSTIHKINSIDNRKRIKLVSYAARRGR